MQEGDLRNYQKKKYVDIEVQPWGESHKAGKKKGTKIKFSTFKT